MFKKLPWLFIIFFVLVSYSFSKEQYNFANIKSSKEILNLIKNNILKWVNNDIITSEIEKANKSKMKPTLDQIKKTDKEWMESKGETAFIKSFIQNKASDFLREKINESSGLFAEIFVMDDQGCIVAETSRTSDFWQGDEDKFQKSYGTGGEIYIDKIKFDESSKKTSIQISLPVYNKNSNLIGAVTVTVDMDKKDLLKVYK